MKKRLLALNLVLVLLLTLVPMSALAVDVKITGSEASYTKTEDSDSVVFTYTPDKDGVYRLFFNTPSTVSGETLVIFDDGVTASEVDISERYYELEAGEEYKFSFKENENGDYSVDVKYYEPVESVDINETNFPDEQFREYVSYNFDVDNDGKLDTYELARNPVLGLTYKDFKSIEGVQHFVYTEYLYCSGNLLTSLPDLSGMNLELLCCDYNGLTELPALPPSIRYLNCEYNEITEVSTLSADLVDLYISGNPLEELPDLTKYENLNGLGIADLELEALPTLPSGLYDLDCSGNKLSVLPALPNGLCWLDCSYNKLTQMPNLPTVNSDCLCSLLCENNELTSIELNSDNNYWYIDVSNNKLPNKAAVTGRTIDWDEESFIFGAQNHTHDCETTTQPATCTSDGKEIVGCKNCEYQVVTITDWALGHDYDANQKCTRCDKYVCSVENSYIEHVFNENNECTLCGAVLPETFTCGLDGSTWTLTRDNTLTITGATDYWSYAWAAEYFNGFDNNIKTIVFDKGTTVANLDWYFWNYNELSIGKDVETIDIQNGYLKSVSVDPDNRYFCAENNALYNKEKTVLIKYCIDCGEKSFTIPDTVEVIGNDAFRRCSFNAISIPEGVAVIGTRAFWCSEELTSIELPSTIVSISYAAFNGCGDIATVSFGGTRELWNNVVIEEENECLTSANIFIKNGNSVTSSADDNPTIVSVIGATDTTLDVSNTIVTVTEKDINDINSDALDEDSFAIIEGSSIIAYDITLKDAQTFDEVQLNGTVQVAIDVPNGYTGGCEVYHVTTDSDGKMTLTPMHAVLMGGKLVFNTDHFSTYMIAHTHDYTDTVTAPTCTDKGFTTHACKYCTDSYTDKATNALGHDYKNGTCTRCNKTDPNYTKPGQTHTHSYTATVVAPTCTEQGYTTYACACGDSYKANYVAAKGHTVVTDAAVAATCTKTGLTAGSHCSVCNAVIKVQETVPTIAHDYKDGTCTRCDAKDPNYTSPAEHQHSYTDVVTAPTCVDKGFTTHTCACGDSYVDTYVDALGHDFKNGECTRCGAEDVTFNPFKDVDKDTHKDYYDAILWAYYNDITKGTNAAGDMFSPELGCTRAQIVTFLWRQSGAPVVEVANPFVDVDKVKHADYYNAILWGYSTGVVKGVSDTEFDPDRICTRAEIVTMLYRLDGENAVKTGTQFTDLTQDWYKDAIAWAVAEKITKGTSDTTFTPDAPCTRAQTVTFLYRYFA